MKTWKCCGCEKDIEVEDDYEYEYCCDGRMCVCMGVPINPAFCDECEDRYTKKESEETKYNEKINRVRKESYNGSC